MLDIKFVRENPEVVKQNIRNKFRIIKLNLVDKKLSLNLRETEIKRNQKSNRKLKPESTEQKEIKFQTDRCSDGTGKTRRSRRS